MADDGCSTCRTIKKSRLAVLFGCLAGAVVERRHCGMWKVALNTEGRNGSFPGYDDPTSDIMYERHSGSETLFSISLVKDNGRCSSEQVLT